MENSLMVFKFENNNVEVIEINNKSFFNVRNVGACLDMKQQTVNEHIQNMSEQQVKKLTNSDTALTSIRKLNNAGENFLTEKGVYKLILKSRKPSAEKFQDWICDEVLPSIRKHGMYATPQTTEEILANPDVLITALQNLKEERKAKEEAIRTKAHIGSKREATCMSHTAIAVKNEKLALAEVKKMERKLDTGREWSTTKRVACLLKFPDQNMHIPLGVYCTQHGLEYKSVKVEHNLYAEVLSYPAKAWKDVYNIDLKDIFDTENLTEEKINKNIWNLIRVPKVSWQVRDYKEMGNLGFLEEYLTVLISNIKSKKNINNKKFIIKLKEDCLPTFVKKVKKDTNSTPIKKIKIEMQYTFDYDD